MELPLLSLLPKYNTDQEHDQHDLEEDIDRIWDMLRTTDEVRIREQERRSPGGRFSIRSSAATDIKLQKNSIEVVRSFSDKGYFE